MSTIYEPVRWGRAPAEHPMRAFAEALRAHGVTVSGLDHRGARLFGGMMAVEADGWGLTVRLDVRCARGSHELAEAVSHWLRATRQGREFSYHVRQDHDDYGAPPWARGRARSPEPIEVRGVTPEGAASLAAFLAPMLTTVSNEDVCREILES